ncbi:MAG: 2-hydroxyacyl-CoA dehydratase [Oscillospiraceae bacterium]|nr:2-hydroxyacyl-CoA dehydratase [Candidatus Ruminococcus equi]
MQIYDEKGRTENKTLLGIDIGSTTAKVVLIENSKLVYSKYERHFSQVRQKTLSMIKEMKDLLSGKDFTVAVSGSAGLGMANAAGLKFVQEVYSTAECVRCLEKDTDAVIELGGEDAKIIFFTGGLDQRMNGSCAGGTGAFIDQMATLLNMTNTEMDEESLSYKQLYPIASRCGVFAKSDVQPLINQGATKADIAASIYQAVVNQTIAGLAQGRKIEGKIMFLGGPLYYCKGLRNRFKETLKLTDENAIFPEYALFAVSIGAALYSFDGEKFTYDSLVKNLEKSLEHSEKISSMPALFETDEDYKEFVKRHAENFVETEFSGNYKGKAYIGIDCGSTTTKLVVIGENDEIIYSYYSSNKGNPVQIVKEQLLSIYENFSDDIVISSCAVTGYGEELIKRAFCLDFGLVETMAHYTAAKHFNKNVDFILDIGGQDIKCFKVHNNSIDSIMLNEACSSGCGSFIETFAKNMGYTVEEFAREGLRAKAPVDLGTRCTVFMNSSVKQAQKDGATIEDISAGLSMSVVKNAIYKVIRATSIEELGKEIVVQGGTFMNDAVLRCFEKEIGRNVVRPNIAGLMGAYGAALYAKSHESEKSTVLTKAEVENLKHESKSLVCKGCQNNCRLTVNIFNETDKLISGNQCEKGAGIKISNEDKLPNLYEFKRNLLSSYESTTENKYTIGIPMSLSMYELYPLWHTVFTKLGFNVVRSPFSTRKIYSKGQFSIPSDTACYPAKIMHGHVETLIDMGVDAIFYPCLTYNIDEKKGDNHYNCPVVAYYSELLSGNMDSLKKTKFLYPYLNLKSEKELSNELYAYLSKYFDFLTLSKVKDAVKCGFSQYREHMNKIYSEGKRAIDFAEKNSKRLMILSGRPYHIDPEICHGVDKLASSLGFVVVSEDSISDMSNVPILSVLNQWTYHSRLYAAAKYAGEHKNAQLVQLVSFGCGVDAITTDEVRTLLEQNGKLYTQIKIDEITNLGAVKIRLRSLIGALEERGE